LILWRNGHENGSRRAHKHLLASELLLHRMPLGEGRCRHCDVIREAQMRVPWSVWATLRGCQQLVRDVDFPHASEVRSRTSSLSRVTVARSPPPSNVPASTEDAARQSSPGKVGHGVRGAPPVELALATANQVLCAGSLAPQGGISASSDPPPTGTPTDGQSLSCVEQFLPFW